MPSDETKPEETASTEPVNPETASDATSSAPAPDADAPETEAPLPADAVSESAEAAAEAPSEEAPAVSTTEDAAPVAATPTVTTTAPVAKAAPLEKGMTPGQRLAAQKAAKAANKAAERTSRKEQEEAARAANEILTMRPAGEMDEGEIRVAETRTYVASHSKQVIYAGAAITAAFLIWFAFDQYGAHRDAVAGRLLVQATEAARAEIREEPIENDRSRRVTFRTVASRDREAIRRYRKVVSEASSSEAAVRARLGMASILMSQGKLTEAKRELEAATGLRGDDPGLGAQAIEGLGVIALEQRQWSQATQRFEELRSLDANRYQHVANYLTARTLFAQGRANDAKPKLRALLDALDEADAPSLPYVQTQAELLLQQIDPSTSRPRPAGLGSGGLNLGDLGNGQIPPEIMEQIQRQMQQQQQGGAPQ